MQFTLWDSWLGLPRFPEQTILQKETKLEASKHCSLLRYMSTASFIVQ